MGTSDCQYCNRIFSAEHGRDGWDRPLLETENFVVVPTLGAIVEGWLLIIPRVHVLCIGALDNVMLRELKELKNQLRTLIRETYAEPTFFEHGPATHDQSVGCCVDHAHLHIAPLGFDLLRESKRALGQDWMRIKGEKELARLHADGHGYLLVEEPLGMKMVCIPQATPHQFFRQVIADQMGVKDKYDWAVFRFEENIFATITKLSSAIRRSDRSYSDADNSPRELNDSYSRSGRLRA